MNTIDISPLALAHLTAQRHSCVDERGMSACGCHALTSSLPGPVQDRLDELRKVEALEQLHLIVAAYGEPLVIRWVKSVAAMQSGTGL